MFDWLDPLFWWLVAAVIWILAAIETLAVFLYGALIAAIEWLVTGLTWLVKLCISGLEGLYNDVIKPVIDTMQKFLDWVRNLVKPVLDYLHKMRLWYDKFFKKFIQPQLQLIGRLRQFLTILKLFHVHWATVLDSYLAKAQARIFKDFEVIRQRLNSVISWVDLIVDPTGLLRKGVLAPSFGQALGDISQLILGKPLDYFGHTFTPGPTNVPPPQGFVTMKQDMVAAQGGADNFWSETAANAQELVNTLNQAESQ